MLCGFICGDNHRRGAFLSPLVCLSFSPLWPTASPGALPRVPVVFPPKLEIELNLKTKNNVQSEQTFRASFSALALAFSSRLRFSAFSFLRLSSRSSADDRPN